uniref:Uncharacterized protein n=1 Tax=Anopheles atroparvus TaxID=41427 RepID=A0A182J3H6_ANOAO
MILPSKPFPCPLVGRPATLPYLPRPADARYGIAGGLALERGRATLPDGDVASFRIRANRGRHENLDRVHQVPVVVVADLAVVIPGVLRAHVFNLQTVAFEQLEPGVAGDDQIGRRYDGAPSAPHIIMQIDGNPVIGQITDDMLHGDSRSSSTVLPGGKAQQNGNETKFSTSQGNVMVSPMTARIDCEREVNFGCTIGGLSMKSGSSSVSDRLLPNEVPAKLKRSR